MYNNALLTFQGYAIVVSKIKLLNSWKPGLGSVPIIILQEVYYRTQHPEDPQWFV